MVSSPVNQKFSQEDRGHQSCVPGTRWAPAYELWTMHHWWETTKNIKNHGWMILSRYLGPFKKCQKVGIKITWALEITVLRPWNFLSPGMVWHDTGPNIMELMDLPLLWTRGLRRKIPSLAASHWAFCATLGLNWMKLRVVRMFAWFHNADAAGLQRREITILRSVRHENNCLGYPEVDARSQWLKWWEIFHQPRCNCTRSHRHHKGIPWLSWNSATGLQRRCFLARKIPELVKSNFPRSSVLVGADT